MPFDTTTDIAPTISSNSQSQAAADPSTLSTIGAAFRQNNMVGSFLASDAAWARMRGGFDDIDRDYNVFDDIKGYENHTDRFESVFNARAAAAVKADIDRETQDKKVLEASGWTGTFANLGASVIDLPTLLPGGVLAKTGGKVGYSLAKSALVGAASAGAAAAIQEAGLQATQETRPFSESATAVGGSVLLGALLGGGVAAVMSRGEYSAASKIMQDATHPNFDASTDALHAELTAMSSPGQSVGAAAAPVETLDDFAIAGSAASKAAQATGKLNPLLRTLQSPSKEVREISSQLMENPVYLKRNLEGFGEAAAETATHEWTRGAVSSAVEDFNSAYTALRKRGVAMTRADFNDAVGEAMRRGDQSPIPEVAQAAQSARSKVFDPLKDRAIKAGLLPEDVSTDTAQSYFSRVWSREKIEANEGEFKGILRKYFDGQIEAAAEREAKKADQAVSALSSVKDDIARSMATRQMGMEDLARGISRHIGFDPGEALQSFQAGFYDVAGRAARTLDAQDIDRMARVDRQMSEHTGRGKFDFLDEADRADYLNGIVDNVYDTLTGRSHDGVLPTDIVVTKRGPLAERTFHIPDHLVEQFVENNADFVMRRYARTMSADIELKNRFGSVTMKDALDRIGIEYNELRAAVENGPLKGQKKLDALKKLNAREKSDTNDIKSVRDLLRGNYRPEVQNTNWARVLNAAMAFNYIRMLGGVTVSSLVDTVRPAMVHGLTAFMSDGMRPLITRTAALKFTKQEAKEAGAIAEKILHSRLATMSDLTDPYARGTVAERFLHNVAAPTFTKMTGILHWGDFMKNMAATMTQNRILKNAEIAASKGFDALPKLERQYMGYLGVGKDKAEILGRLFGEHGETLDGIRVANSERWPAEAEHMLRAWRAAINKDVDSIIVTKGMGDVPLFANTPTGRALLQFKSFMLAGNQRVLLRGLQESKTRFWGGVLASSGVGMLIYALKQIESGRPLSDNPGTWIAEGLNRSGTFDLLFEANNAMEKLGVPGMFAGAAAAFPNASQRPPASKFASRSLVGSYLGPSFELATDLISVASTAAQIATGKQDGLTAGDIGTIRRLTPFASLPYWRWLLDGQIITPAKEAAKK